MGLPAPSVSFSLPSLYDNLELNCRLYFPKLSSSDDHEKSKGLAIFAHPYASLGGSFDDPVVHSVGSLLVNEGFLLVTFNFRGAEGSSGRTSWTGKAELGDYTAVYAFVLSLMNIDGVQQHVGRNSAAPVLLLGGYSYGSMITSYVPAIEVVQKILDQAEEGSAEYEIKERADKLGQTFLGYCETRDRRGRHKPSALSTTHATFGGYESAAASTKIRRESSRHSVDVERVRRSVDRVRRRLSRGGSDEVDTHSYVVESSAKNILNPETVYLIISPLFGAVSNFATMFSSLKFERRDRNSTAARNVAIADPDQRFCHSTSLVVFGTHDHFTSSRKTRDWCERLKRSDARFDFCEINDAGHFWHDEKLEVQLLAAVKEWLHRLGV